MRTDLPNLLRLPVKVVVISLAISAVTVLAVPNAWSQQTQDETSKPEETEDTLASQTKPAAQKKPAARKKTGLFDSFKGSFDIAGLTRQVEGDRPGKFQETRDFPQGFSLRNFRLRFESAGSPYFITFKAQEILERDQRYSGEVGRVGKFRTEILWDQIPKYYSNGRTFHFQAAPGLLVVNPDLRASLQAVPDAGVAASALGPTLPALVRQNISSEAGVELRVRSDQFLFTQSYHPNKNWEFYGRAQHLRLSGTRPRPTGTFAREGNGPAGDGVWEAMGAELPEPVEYGTTNLTVGVQYSRAKWRIGLDYNLSLFTNSIPSLTWENPFRVTDALAIAPAFGVGRNRFARAQLALPPDNDYHSFTVHGSLDLPRETQLRGELTWGRGTQNQAFLPYTLNSALTSANLPAGVPGLFGLALPQPSLNGVVHTLDQDYALATKPWKNMRFLLQYRSDDRDNQSSLLRFPALPSFGDSGERTPVDFYKLPIENFPTSYTRQNTTATWQWDPRKNLNWELEYDWEIWSRRFFETPRTNEHSLQGRLAYKPRFIRGVTLKGDYLYSHRIPRFYLTQPLTFNPTLQGNALGGWVALPTTQLLRGVPMEFNLLRRFDDDNRIRKDGGASLEVARSEKLTYSVAYRYSRDDHDKNLYGLHYDVLSTVDAQVSYFPKENAYFYANYTRDQQQTGYQDLGHLIIGATQNVTACCAQFPIANTYDRDSKIHLDMFQFGLNTSTEGEKTVLDISYVLSFARDKTNTANPFTILPISLRTAGAYNYPDVINRQQEVNISVTHQLREGLDLGLNYRFEPYRLDDYYTNGLQPYAGPKLSEAGGAGTINVPRYLFLDARFTSMHANVATVFLRYQF